MSYATLQLFKWLSLVVLIFVLISPASSRLKLPRLGTFLKIFPEDPNVNGSESKSVDYETFFYNQTLDHFNFNPESYTTFQQRYFINFKYWGGAKARAPIFVYLGAESSIDRDPDFIGTLLDNAPRFKSLLVYIEHRFYGKSVPLVTFKEALKNKTLRGYFNSAQAIADYAEVILHIKKMLSATYSPIIVVGGSYGGMLASWFRLKYPHIALGALASSAPILYFDDIIPSNGYFSIVSKDFKEESESCYQTIRDSWSKISEVASKHNGLSILSRKFRTCKPLNTSTELKDYIFGVFAAIAQYNRPPEYPLTMVCGAIDGAPKGTDSLDRIFAGMVAYFGNGSCYFNYSSEATSETSDGWTWQRCSEMAMPISWEMANDTLFEPAPYNLTSFEEDCKSMYGVTPRSHWVTTYYGGHDIKRVLHDFASNIIFSNGLKDPYSSGGVLENISDTVVAITTVTGAHCVDILRAKPSDPQWVIEQREKEVVIIERWIAKYYDELRLFKNSDC